MANRLRADATPEQKKAFFTLELRRLISTLLPKFYQEKFQDTAIQSLADILVQVGLSSLI